MHCIEIRRKLKERRQVLRFGYVREQCLQKIVLLANTILLQ